MKKIKRFINVGIPETVCNLNCSYCFVSQVNKKACSSSALPHSVEDMRKALSVARLGGYCCINLCAQGETLLVKGIVDLVEAYLLEGHTVSVVTNGLIRERIKELCALSEDMRQELFFKISFHYLELMRINRMDYFWENVEIIKNAGISFTLELTVNDESVPYIDEIIALCEKKAGTKCHIIEARVQDGKNWPRMTDLPLEEHERAWSKFDSTLFAFQQRFWGERRTEFCYAGEWTISLDLKTGDYCPCFGGGHRIGNIYENMDQPLRFNAMGRQCPWGHCFVGHVLLTFGVVPDYPAPSYAATRNRKCADGSEWLQPHISQYYTQKLSDNNKGYSENRQLLTNWVMGTLYQNYNGAEYKKLQKAVKECFEEKQWKRVAIYGAGILGKELLALLRELNIEVVCFLDKRYNEIETEIDCVNYDSKLDNVDAIIITVYDQNDLISESLKENGNTAEAISILELYGGKEDGIKKNS